MECVLESKSLTLLAARIFEECQRNSKCRPNQQYQCKRFFVSTLVDKNHASYIPVMLTMLVNK